VLTSELVSWGAWPQAGQQKINTGEDVAYKSALKGKKYIMGVSPYFYTSGHHSRFSPRPHHSHQCRPPTMVQELVLLQRVALVRPVAADP
jgi:hypothetical protein